MTVATQSSLAFANRHGSSLVDLVIATLIMAIMAAVAAPRFSAAVAALRCEAAAERIAADLNYARKRAMFTCSSVTVTFTETPPGYNMTGVQHPFRPAEEYAVRLADIDSSVRLDQWGTESLTFNSYGIPDATSITTPITIRTASQLCSVVIDPATGEAGVE